MAYSSSLQSPINIITKKEMLPNKEEMPKAPALEKLIFEYGDKTKVEVEFAEHYDVKSTIDDNAKPYLNINIDAITNKYNLKQFHFHTPAEHKIDGVSKEIATEALRRAGAKLPIRTRVVSRS